MTQVKKPSQWVLQKIDESSVREFAAELGFPYLPALVLWSRGYRQKESVEKFLNPTLEQLFDPFALPDMSVAVDRLLSAQKRGEKVLVHGDYDVDGITGTALLVRGLSRLGIDAHSYIPHRLKEGYGLSVRALDEAKTAGASIILTVDCGITALEEASLAQVAEIDLIVTDHHEPGDELPPALAVIDPKRSDSAYPFPDLAGVGVAYKLLSALNASLNESLDELNQDLDLVALGTIADVAPLVSENRVFAQYGLKQITHTVKEGIQALLAVSKLSKMPVAASNVAFGLAPRLNASGRMADARQALRLLLTADEAEAHSLAKKMDKHNQERRQTEERILEQARVLAEHLIKEENPRVLVCHRPNWHEGVIGIVASRLVDEYYRPTVLLADKEGRLKGSGRSVRGFHLYQALSAAKEHLVTFGGHEAAAGLVMEKSKLPAFTQTVNNYARDYPDDVFVPRVYLEAFAQLSDFDDKTRELLKCLQPYGMGNPQPCFATSGLEVVGMPRVFGRKHIKFTVRADDVTLPVLAFNKSELILKLEPGRKQALDLAYRVTEDSYWGKGRVQLVCKDLHFNYEPEDFGVG